MRLLDVNILVFAHREDSERHQEFQSWLVEALASEEGCAVSELVLSGCLRIIVLRQLLAHGSFHRGKSKTSLQEHREESATHKGKGSMSRDKGFV